MGEAFITRRGGGAVTPEVVTITAASGSLLSSNALVGVTHAELLSRSGGFPNTGGNVAVVIVIEDGAVSSIYYAASDSRCGLNISEGDLPVFDQTAGTITCTTSSGWSSLFSLRTSSGNTRLCEYNCRILSRKG
jgi:hypothetical protein